MYAYGQLKQLQGFMVRLLIILFFILLNIGVNAQNTSNSAQIEYAKRLKKDTISGIYIPKDIDDCLNQLDKILSDSIKMEIKKMTESEFTGRAHSSLGRWLRNNWALWSGSRLQVYFSNLKFGHSDDMSHFILSCYYQKLQGNKVHTKREIKRYREKIKELTKREKIKIYAKTISKKEYQDLDSAYLVADKIIEISFQDIDKLPNKILKFKNLKSLDIENCSKFNWSKTFKLISKFDNLTDLSLYNNHVESYPEEIGLITSLTKLRVGTESIRTLPESIISLKNLKDVMISECPKIDLSILIKQLADLDGLAELDLSEDSLRTIPIEINKLQQLKELVLDNNLLTELPQGVKELKNLTSLRLFSNRIQDIDIKKEELTKLKKINLCYNEFVKFPIGLTKLKNLESIEMWYNEIETIPTEISNLISLKMFNIQYNKISEDNKQKLHNLLPNIKICY